MDAGVDAGAPSIESHARIMLDPATSLPARPEVIALAQSIEAVALKEGASERAVELHTLAAQLVERAWRIEHRDQDAKEAIDLYRAAGRDLSFRGACHAAVKGAEFAGEFAKDATATYAELYRVERRSNVSSDGSVGPCADVLGGPLAMMTAFRPPPEVLAAIDQGLAGENALSDAALDASAVLVAPRITHIEQWAGPAAARVVVHVDKPAHFRVGDVGSEHGRHARTYVDFDGVELGGAAHETTPGGIVSRIVAEATTTGSRVALDLNGSAYRRVFHLLEPFRVVVDIARQPPGTQRGSNRSVARVVIDPGHGGSDPGAIGPSGQKEKDVTLAIAHKIVPVLGQLGIEAALTRDDDRTVTLEERTARANAVGADLFVSIHCNASEKAAKRGIETYVLDTTTSDMAGRVAARENATSQAASNEVAQLLASMRLADQSTRSIKFAELLQKSGIASLESGFSDIVDGGVHKAGFYVLVGARMPAVLFETSYISNATDEQRLGSANYQERLADAIVNAIKAYREGR